MPTRIARSRNTQPPHLRVDDAWRVLKECYKDSDLEELRQADADGKSKLAFEYNNKHGVDKDALFKHRDVLKGYCMANPTGVWNWTTVLGAVKKWDQQNLAHLLANNKAHGCKSPDMAASNLAQMLQDVRNHKRNCKTGSRTPGWLQEIIVHLSLRPETS